MSETFQTALADRYRVERELGRGGMATVYLAEDLRHHRRVAIKVLHPELSAILGTERFLKEIELTANLQHPHILPLFDSGESEGRLYYVMPYVEGETLRRRLDRERQLPVQDAIRITVEAADALEYAHRHGVVHRDIKPENILLHDGRPLLADFGIALAVQEAGGIRMTQTGMSLGTPQYMAPEQAMGDKAVDHRADIYALGAVAYEMLAGEPPFTGPSSQAIVAKVMTEEPKPLGIQRRTIPEGVETAVLTALQKLPADRFRSAADFARALTADVSVPRARPRAHSPRRWLISALAAVALATAAYSLGRGTGGPKAAEFTFGRAAPITWDAGLEIHPSLSPDGRFVAYAAGLTALRHQVFVRPVSGGRPVALITDTTDSQSGPSWSPDGTRVLFLSRRGVYSAPAFGGPARSEIAPRVDGVHWAGWSPDGRTVAFATVDSIFVRPEGGQPRLVARVHEPGLCNWSPSGRLIACASGNMQYAAAGRQFGNLSPSRLVVIDVADGSVDSLTDQTAANQSPVWIDENRLLFVSNRHGSRDIYSVGRSSGRSGIPEAQRLTTGLDAHSISFARTGNVLAYAAVDFSSNVWALPIPASGSVSPYSAEPVTYGTQLVESFTVSPDGRWLVYDSDLAGNADIYRIPLAGGEPERLTSDPSDDFFPSLSPDGREVAFHSWRTGNRDVFVQPLDGGPVQQVTATPTRQEVNPLWSPDGNALVFFEFEGAFDTLARSAIWIARRDASGKWSEATRRVARGNWGMWSRDGSTLLYGVGAIASRIMKVGATAGEPTLIYDAERWNGPLAEEPVWSPDNRTIYFKSHDANGLASIWAIPAAGGAPPRLLTRFDDPARPSSRYNVAVGRDRLYYAIDEKKSDIWVIELGGRAVGR